VKRAAPWAVGAALVAFVGWKLHTSHFDWAGFGRSWRTADWRLLLLATVIIYGQNLLRAARWAIFLRPAFAAAGRKPIHWYSLVGSQFVGFTGLSLFGRIGELIRPLIVSRRTGLTFSSQIAVVAVERVFDLGAFALIFSLNLLLSPSLQTLPYHDLFHKVGYAIAALTIILIVFVAAVRLSGAAMAHLLGRFIGIMSPKAGRAAAEKILSFRDGLNVIDNTKDFALVAILSLITWAVIAVTYVAVMKAFPSPVHDLSISRCLVLMGFSLVGSLVQFPGVGGGSQVATITALTLLFDIPKELAVSAGLMLWLVQNMSIIPAGLIYARVEGISLRGAAHTSEEAERPAA
jgi:uncharacterized protein (TIRG00374 family)